MNTSDAYALIDHLQITRRNLIDDYLRHQPELQSLSSLQQSLVRGWMRTAFTYGMNYQCQHGHALFDQAINSVQVSYPVNGESQ